MLFACWCFCCFYCCSVPSNKILIGWTLGIYYTEDLCRCVCSVLDEAEELFRLRIKIQSFMIDEISGASDDDQSIEGESLNFAWILMTCILPFRQTSVKEYGDRKSRGVLYILVTYHVMCILTFGLWKLFFFSLVDVLVSVDLVERVYREGACVCVVKRVNRECANTSALLQIQCTHTQSLFGSFSFVRIRPKIRTKCT